MVADRKRIAWPTDLESSPSGPERNIDWKGQPFRGPLRFSSTMEGVCAAEVKAQQQAQPKDSRLNGSALALQAAFADIDIRKDGPVYYWLN